MLFFGKKENVELICFDQVLLASRVILNTRNFNMLHLLGFHALKEFLINAKTLGDTDISPLIKNIQLIEKKVNQLAKKQQKENPQPKTQIEKDLVFIKGIKRKHFNELFLIDQVRLNLIQERVRKKKYFFFYEKIFFLQSFFKNKSSFKEAKILEIEKLIQPFKKHLL